MKYRALPAIGLILTLAGCSAGFAVGEVVGLPSPSPAGRAAVASAPSADAIPALEPVSRSDMSADAAAALSACVGTDVDLVQGMGFVARAEDVPLYVPLWGTEPELKAGAAAWVVALSGKVEFPRGFWAMDPICVVIDGIPTIFAPGGYGKGSHEYSPAASPPRPPASLPPLRP